jgi:aryl-alcohol dehydrogenase-like predicted oxidoreductase
MGIVELRAFGKTDLKVSPFGLGCARIGGIFQSDTKGFLNLLSVARDFGINFFDTADMYSQGESEVLVGKAFRRVRQRVIITSKAGFCLPGRRRFAARLKPILRPLIRALKVRRPQMSSGARGALSQNFEPGYLEKAVEGSLRRLRTDYLDLFQLHSPPADVIVRGEWQSALDRLKQAGKIRYYGISCDTTEACLAALKFPAVASLQFLFNLLERGGEDLLLPMARAQGVAVIARECLANGLLVKDASEIDLGNYTRSDDERKHREEQLATFRRQAQEEGRSLMSKALRYAADTEGVSVALVGARNADQLRGLLRAL